MIKFTFTGSSGHSLAARLDMPEGETARAYALFAHCFTCSKDIFAAGRIARRLTGQGIGVLRFDFTGIGMSEGDFSNTNFTSNVDDLVLAADHMRQEYKAPTLLIGHSFGGTACIKAARRIPEVRALVTIGSPADTNHIQHQFFDRRDEILENGEAEVLLAGRPFRLKKQFIEDIEAQNITEDLAQLKRAMLIMHSPIDATVGLANAATLFASAKHPKSFVSLGDSDHLMSKPEYAEFAGSVIAAWSEKYI